MQQFRKTINGVDFNFQPVVEGKDEVCRVSAENQHFKMTTDENGNWEIRQQVPTWVKNLEASLGKAIDEENISR